MARVDQSLAVYSLGRRFYSVRHWQPGSTDKGMTTGERGVSRHKLILWPQIADLGLALLANREEDSWLRDVYVSQTLEISRI